MSFKLAILLVCLFVSLVAAKHISPFKAVQNDGICGGDTTCLYIDSPRGSAAGCCWDTCAGQQYYKEHLDYYDNKCSGGKICCGYLGFGK